MVEIDRLMAAGRRRWRAVHVTQWLCQGAVAGGLAGAAVYLAGGGRGLAFGLVAAGACLVPIARWRRRPDPPALAHYLDRAAGLGSALTAAVEFRHRDDPWCQAQRRHTARLLVGLDPAALLPWRGSGWAVAAAATLLAVILLPADLRATWSTRRDLATVAQEHVPPPLVGGGQGAGDYGDLAQPLPPAAPSPAVASGGEEGMAKQPTRSAPQGDQGRAIDAATARTSSGTLPSPTVSSPGLGRGRTLSGGIPGDATARGAESTGDIGTAAATTPLLGAPDRAIAPPRAAALSLGGGALPGSVAGVPGAGPATLHGMAPEPVATLTPAPPEAVAMHMRPIVARYFDLLHPSPEGDEP